MNPRWPLTRIRQRDTVRFPDTFGAELAAAMGDPPQRCPIGLNVRQDVDYAKVLAYVKRLGGVSALLCHCDTGVLPKLRDFLPWADMVIWRPRMFVDEKLFSYGSPAQWVEDRKNELRGAGYQDGAVWLHLHNEGAWSTQKIVWEYEACDYGLPFGMKFVVLNPAVGTPEPEQIGMAHQVIALAGQHPDRIRIGLHEYFSVYGTRTAPWYLKRWSFWEEYRQSQSDLKPIQYVITEFGSEDISDDHTYTDTLPRPAGLPADQHIGPVGTLDAAYAATYNDAAHNSNPKPYPGLDVAYAEQVKVAYSQGGYNAEEIAAVILFGWGKKESRWVFYDVGDRTVFQDAMVAWDANQDGTPPDTTEIPIEPEPEEEPMIIDPGDYTLHPAAGYVNLRESAGTSYGVQAKVPDAATVTLTGNSALVGVTTWVQLSYAGQTGWMAIVQDTFEAQFTKVEQPPAPSGEYVTPEQLTAALDALRDELLGKLAAINASITTEMDTIPTTSLKLLDQAIQEKIAS